MQTGDRIVVINRARHTHGIPFAQYIRRRGAVVVPATPDKHRHVKVRLDGDDDDVTLPWHYVVLDVDDPTPPLLLHHRGAYRILPCALGQPAVKQLSIVQMPTKTVTIDDPKHVVAHLCEAVVDRLNLTVDHLCILQGVPWRVNGQWLVPRYYGVLFDGPLCGRDDPRIFRSIPSASALPLLRLAPDASVNLGRGLTANLHHFPLVDPWRDTTAYDGPVDSSVSNAIQAFDATISALPCAPLDSGMCRSLVPSKDEVFDLLANVSAENVQHVAANYLRTALNEIQMHRCRWPDVHGVDLSTETMYGYDRWSPSGDGYQVLDEEDMDWLTAAFQRMGYGVLVHDVDDDCLFSIQFPGHCLNLCNSLDTDELMRRRYSVGDDDRTPSDYARAQFRSHRVFYPRPFTRIRYMGVLRCVPRLLAWLRSARIVLADPARPGVLAAEEAAVDAAMLQPVFTDGALGKRGRE